MTTIDETQVHNPPVANTNETPASLMPEEPIPTVTTPPRTQVGSPEPGVEAQPAPGHEATHPEEAQDPRLAVLQGMFPTFDASVLLSVLESVGGDQDRAIDILLGMNDPEYKPQLGSNNTMSQTELDEQFARTLLLEEESQHQRSWRPYEGQPQGQGQDQLPYEPRQQPPRAAQGQQGSGDDSLAQIQEQIGKFAETGKRTFNTLLSKVKAKIQEFDSGPSQPQGASTAHHPLPHGDSWSTTAQSQAYYTPNAAPVQGYEAHPHSTVVPSQPTAVPVHSQPTAVPVHPSTATTEPASTQAPASSPPNAVDPAKIGLLPKRPVALGASPQPSRTGDDDDDIEYVENPFEENKHR